MEELIKLHREFIRDREKLIEINFKIDSQIEELLKNSRLNTKEIEALTVKLKQIEFQIEQKNSS